MTTILTIDIGGTKCEAALWQSSCTQPRLLQKLHIPTDFADESALMARLFPLPPDLEAAVFALAGRLGDHDGDSDTIRLTNNSCTIHPGHLAAQLPSGCRLAVLNDLEALAHAIPHLPPSSCQDINPTADFARLYSPSPRLAVAAGTGFGAAVLLPGFRVLPTEAGHTAFAPLNATQAEICRHIANKTKHPVTCEDLLSGSGLSRIHQALTGQDLTPAQICAAATAADTSALGTVSQFSAMLGAALGNLALCYLPGGLYLGGGVLRHLSPIIDHAALMANLAGAGPFADYLAALPVQLITEESPTLLGAVMYAERFLLG